MFLTFPPSFISTNSRMSLYLHSCTNAATMPSASPGPVGIPEEPGQHWPCPQCSCALWGPSARVLLPLGLKCYRQHFIYSMKGFSCCACFCLCTNGESQFICEKMAPPYWRDSLKLEEGPHTIAHSGRKVIFAITKQNTPSKCVNQ